MDDVHAINVAKTEFREAYDTGDVDRLLAVLDGGLIDYSNGSFNGHVEGAKTALQKHPQDLFAKYHSHLVPVIIGVAGKGGHSAIFQTRHIALVTFPRPVILILR